MAAILTVHHLLAHFLPQLGGFISTILSVFLAGGAASFPSSFVSD